MFLQYFPTNTLVTLPHPRFPVKNRGGFFVNRGGFSVDRVGKPALPPGGAHVCPRSEMPAGKGLSKWRYLIACKRLELAFGGLTVMVRAGKYPLETSNSGEYVSGNLFQPA